MVGVVAIDAVIALPRILSWACMNVVRAVMDVLVPWQSGPARCDVERTACSSQRRRSPTMGLEAVDDP
jgi:hypothetical protein